MSETNGLPNGLADEIARMAGANDQPGIDLNQLATRWGVSTITRRHDMVPDGRTVWEPDGRIRIELNAERPATRQRFTLAHEIGHVLIANPRGHRLVRHRSPGLTQDTEETLCDWIAASLLMPHTWIRTYAHRRPSLNLVRLIAARADVSLSAATTRLQATACQDISLLRLRRGNGRWVIAGQAGVPRSWVGQIRLPDPTCQQLDRLPHHLVRSDLTLIVNRQPVSVVADLSRHPQGCVALLVSPTAPPHQPPDRTQAEASHQEHRQFDRSHLPRL